MPSTQSLIRARLARWRAPGTARPAGSASARSSAANWSNRDRAIGALLLLQAVGLLAFALASGHSGVELVAIGMLCAVPALVILAPRAGRKVPGSADRPLFLDRVRQALARARRHPAHVAVLVVDLDHFTTVNDGLGRAAGDQLLVAVGQRLQVCLRPGDTASRLGGDEFGICVETTDGQQVTAIAERLLQAVREPMVVAGRELSVAASVGIAIGSGDVTADELLHRADIAMSAARTGGGGRYAMFDGDLPVARIDRLDLHGELEQAIHRDELRLQYQPIVALDTGAVTGVEALVYWDHPTRGMIPPTELISLAEDAGLIVPIGRRVLTEACRQLRRWQDTEPRATGLTVAVNVSGQQLLRPQFLPELSQLLRDCDLPPEALVLEVAESVIMPDAEAMIRQLRQLKALGVRLAIDDFGIGYSSLSYLQRFPVDILKIDRSFVRPLANPLSDMVGLPRAIVELARMLRLHTVAQGIDTPEQATAVRRMGCDSAQGVGVGRPCSPDLLPALIRRNSAPALVPAGEAA